MEVSGCPVFVDFNPNLTPRVAFNTLLAPAKTPRAIIDQLNRAVQSAFDPELKAKLAESGIEVATSRPEDVQRLISRDIKLHAELVKASGMTPQ